jgi:hypothetical protein
MSGQEKQYKRLLADLKVGDSSVGGKVLVGSFVVGPSVERVRRLVGLSRAKVRACGRNLREGQIWLGRYVDVGEWLDEKGTADPISFALHALVADGLIERREART